MTFSFRSFRYLSILVAWLWHVSLGHAIETNIPDLGQHSQSVLSTQTEQTMGNSVMQKIHGSNFVTTDPIVSEYLQQLALKFTTYSGLRDYKLHFFGINTPELNAFAFFGGHVGVHSGLILTVQSESELAAVLAHETAHICQHHLARIIASSKQQMPITFAEVLAAIAIGALGAPEAGAHLATAALAGHVQHLINFTREHEQEADRIGIALLAKSGFDPTAMARVFQRMKQNTLYADHPPEYLLTHPIFDSRIADAENRAASLPYRQVPDSLFFHLTRARLDADRNERLPQKISRLKRNAASNQTLNKTAAEYGYAIALLRSQHPEEGLKILKNLTVQHPNEWIIEMGVAEAEQTMGQFEFAANRLQQLHNRYPHNYAIIQQYALVLLDQKRGRDVINLLQPYRKSHFDDPLIHQMLARSYSLTRQRAEVHRSQAEWHFARGESQDALQQLRLALEQAKGNSSLIAQINHRKANMKHILERQKETKM